MTWTQTEHEHRYMDGVCPCGNRRVKPLAPLLTENIERAVGQHPALFAPFTKSKRFTYRGFMKGRVVGERK